MLQGEIHHVVNPDPYRGTFGSDSTSYAKDLQDHIDFGTSGKVAGFIAETIQVAVGFLSLSRTKFGVFGKPNILFSFSNLSLTVGSWRSS